MIDPSQLSPERRKVWEKINQMMDVSYGCAESFVAAVGEHLWGEVSDPVKMISTGFSGGVGGTHEELCGGVSGAAIILGLIYGRTTNDEALMIRCKRLISEHRDRFMQEFDTTVCQELRDARFGADEENPCSAMIAPAAFMLLDILEEEQVREAEAQSNTETSTGPAVEPIDRYQESHKNAPLEELLQELERVELPHEHRNWIGEELDSRGDQRPGVGLGTDGLPEIVWLEVPGGTIEVERAGTYMVEPYLIAKYPLTAGQYRAFLEAGDGFGNPDWWKGLAVDPGHRSAPGQQRFEYDNHPRDNVSWYDGVACCRWMTSRLASSAKAGCEAAARIKESGWEIRLPTEWEWQMAATGGNAKNKFPWGLEWDQRRAHTKHNQLNKTTAVGLYPAGISPIGALDLSGNIWEWCLNCYEDPGNLDLGREDRRVLRGGSWYHWGSYAHTSMRSRYFPEHRYNAGGFRLACGKSF